jgi:hypothetical protein
LKAFYNFMVCAETLVLEVARSVLEKHGQKLTAEVQKAATGRKPLDAWQATIDQLHMQDITAQQLFDESEPFLKTRFGGNGAVKWKSPCTVLQQQCLLF